MIFFSLFLYEYVLDQKDKIPSNNPFWNDLKNFLIKWLNNRKKNDNDNEKFKKRLDSLNGFILIFKEKGVVLPLFS